MNKIILTGATGFLGECILEMLVDSKNKYDLAIVTREYKKEISIHVKQFNFNEDMKKFENNIIDFQPEIVIHLASFLTASDDYDAIDNIINSNIVLGTKLLQALSKTKVKYFISTGSFSEYYWNDGNLDPAYLYAASKSAFRCIVDYYSKKLKFNYINVIPYTIYGEGDKNKKVIDIILESQNSDKSVEMTSGQQVLDFIHVKDVASFYLKLIEKLDYLSITNVDFHVGTGIGTSIRMLAKMIETLTNKKTNITWGAREYRPLDVMRAIAHISKSTQFIDWVPSISLDAGLNQLLVSKGAISENN